jgi:hypothetical protein
MRVTEIEMISNNEEVFSLGLRNPGVGDKYLAKAIIGLGADELTPKFYGFGLVGGAKFYDFSLPPREVVIRIVLNPNSILNEHYSDIRDELYKAISSTRSGEVLLMLKAGATSVAEIKGRITKFEVPHFSRVPELQITLKCDDPLLRGTTTEYLRQPELGTTQPRKVTDAMSTSPHGCVMKFTFTAAVPTFIIQDKAETPNWQFSVSPTGGFLVGDVLTVSSERMKRFVSINRGGVTLSQANKVSAGSLWPVIFPGLNEFYSNLEAEVTWDEVSYRNAYWGV